jgi:hypothetical protein
MFSSIHGWSKAVRLTFLHLEHEEGAQHEKAGGEGKDGPKSVTVSQGFQSAAPAI